MIVVVRLPERLLLQHLISEYLCLGIFIIVMKQVRLLETVLLQNLIPVRLTETVLLQNLISGRICLGLFIIVMKRVRLTDTVLLQHLISEHLCLRLFIVCAKVMMWMILHSPLLLHFLSRLFMSRVGMVKKKGPVQKLLISW